MILPRLVSAAFSLGCGSSPSSHAPHFHPQLLHHRFVVLTTSDGIMDHEEARRKHTGGKVLGFFY